MVVLCRNCALLVHGLHTPEGDRFLSKNTAISPKGTSFLEGDKLSGGVGVQRSGASESRRAGTARTGSAGRLAKS
jgi:hypothetical protein